MKKTEASLTLDASQLATASLDVEPLDMTGHLRVRGTAQVPKLRGRRATSSTPKPSTDPMSYSAASQGPESPYVGHGHDEEGPRGEGGVVHEEPTASRTDEAMDIRLNIKDGGMSLLSSLAPDCEWRGGQANIDLRLHGQYNDPK